MLFITTQPKLNEICKSLQLESLIAIDTEFERRHTYFPKLSIIQIVTERFEIIIDSLASINLAPLKSVLFDNKITKILHSSSQDLEIFYNMFNALPENIFDTQVAAGICGYDECLSYGNICNILLSIQIDKKYQAANWIKRPLAKHMLEYAINDARYLIPIYQKLYDIIKTYNLQEKYSNKIDNLLNIKNYQLNKADAWKKVRFHKKPGNFINRMKIIAGYREECARNSNVPRRNFASDRDLIKICSNLPITNKDLENLQLERQFFTKSCYETKLLQLCMHIKEMENMEVGN